MVDNKDIQAAYLDQVRVHAMNKLAQALVESAMHGGLLRSCLNCEFWNEGPETCNFNHPDMYKKRPPAKVIVVGCQYHTDNIPF